MKRKLDANNEPASVQINNPGEESGESKKSGVGFNDLGLDSRIVAAIARQKFEQPTLVQKEVIPKAIGGHDILAKAKTGSGKTLAYLAPCLHRLLQRKQIDSSNAVSALILVPTRELADQVFKAVSVFLAFCGQEIQVVKLTDKVSDAVQRSLLSSQPDLVISTPAKAWSSINGSSLSLDKLSYLVLDEADLVLSYGYNEDLESLARSLPKGVQTILMSATLTTEVDTLKSIFCRNPVLLDLEEPEAEDGGVTQYYVKCAEDEKFLLSFIIMKLQLVKGKVIIFVSDIDRCYRLKLFFEQFGIRSTVLNSELPVNSRIHVVEEFNRHVFDVIIASDENEILGDVREDAEPDSQNKGVSKESSKKDGGEHGRKEYEDEGHPKTKRRTSRRDKEYNISRGIDFRNVAAVINFDLPTTVKSYTHRIGRTARAGQTGLALSFVVPRELYRKHMATSIESAENDELVLAKIIRQQAKIGKEVSDYKFDMKQAESFRYRMNDALRAVTKVAIREARSRELRQELLNSSKLARFFEENPTELRHLKHDGELRTARRQAHLAHVPSYLLPNGKQALMADEVGFVPLRKMDKKNRRSKYFSKGKGKGSKIGGLKADPLRTFKARRKTK